MKRLLRLGIRRLSLVVSIFVTLFILGCVTVERKGETIVIDPWKKIGEFFAKLKGETTEKQAGPREEALRRYGLEGLRQGLIVEPPVITPEVVKPGDKVKQELQFALLAPEEGKRFNVSETIVLSSSKETTELIKRETEKPQGIHLSTIEFTIPADLDRGEYKLISTINIGGQKKTVSGVFKLKEKDIREKTDQGVQRDEGFTEKTDSTIAGIIVYGFREETHTAKRPVKREITFVQPLIEYKKGEFQPLLWYFDESDMEPEDKKIAQRIKHALLNHKTYWLYDEGILVGRFIVTEIVPGGAYPDAGGWHIVIAGDVKWEKDYRLEIPPEEKWMYEGDGRIVEGIVALSQPVTQRAFYLKKEILSKEQSVGLERLLHSTLKNVKEGCPKATIQKFVGKTPKERSIQVLDIDSNSQPEVYIKATWLKEEPLYFIDMYVLATWKDKNWEVIRHTATCSEEGYSGFNLELVADIDGDGITELILRNIKGETGDLVLYQLREKQLKKVLEIGGFGL
jgi:hypothetical protein